MKESQKNNSLSRKKGKLPLTDSTVFEHGKIPPQAIELEEAVLGAIMLEKDALTAVIDIIKSEMFYKEAHQKIYDAIIMLFNKSESVDILTVTNQLKKNGELDIIGGAYYITQLTSRVASSANIEYHARIISQKYLQRELIRISTQLIKDAFDDTTDVFELLDTAEQNLFAVSEGNLKGRFSNMKDSVVEAIRLIKVASRQDGGFTGVPTGFSAIDRITGGWQKSDLIVIAARPGMGKTALMLTMARNITVEYKKPVAFFSLEMNTTQLVTRLISSEAMLKAEKLKKGTLLDHEWEQLNAKVGSLSNAPLIIDDSPALTIFDLRAKARRLKQQYNIELIIIDYLQLMSGSADNKGNREQEISNISRSLKSLAKELNIPIIALSQLSREVEKRGGAKRPILSDLRESGAIEQDADMVIFIYRAEYYKIELDDKNQPTKGMAEIIIAKHRNGATADIPLKFIDHYAKFVDVEDTTYDNTYSFSHPYSDRDFPDVQPTFTMPSKMNDMPDDDIEKPI